MSTTFALVAVGRPVRGEFTYRVPDALRDTLKPGIRIKVPFGRGTALGFYLAPAPNPSDDVLAKLRDIDSVLEAEPAFTPDIVELVRFAAAHYRYPLGEALRSTLPPGMTKAAERFEAKPDLVFFAVVLPGAEKRLEELKRAHAQHATLSYLLAVEGRANVEEVAHAIPGARGHLKSLVERGLVHIDSEVVNATVKEGLAQNRPAALTEEQAVAVDVLGRALETNTFSPYLLHGVTGSGKTEVYLRLAETALQRERGTLILVPEIALTPQLVGRFRSRFGHRVAVLHSALKDRERLLAWQQLRSGDLRIAVGVRSAIFAPMQNLGLIVVDEEHDPSFKQDEKLRYQARDLAVVRASHAKCLVVLGSATPSLETLENVRKGRYQRVTLTRRVDDRPMPTVGLVDLRITRPRTPETKGTEPPVLSDPLREAMVDTLAKGQQVILFLNRRGHATFLTCEVCGLSLKCSECDVCMTLHLSSRRVQCHYCGQADPVPMQCSDCTGPLLRLGVGTERIEAEVTETFPHARVARLDRDAVSSNEKLTDLLSAFARREIDILIGTQMVAKGHDFPGVTLVAVVMADTALSLPDFRAAERTFHLLTQVAGRAGRGKAPGRVIVQSYNPEAPPIAFMLRNDFDGFAAAELTRRQSMAWPPMTRMAAIRIEGESPLLVQNTAEKLAGLMERHMPPASEGVRLLGPAPAPIARIKGKTRWQIVIKGPSHPLLHKPLAAVEAVLDELPSTVKVVIDVDPSAML